MAVDTPATIAVVGAGPVGLEAALYARFLGYDVRVYERGRVGENLLQSAGPRPTVAWQVSTSPLGIAALTAQRPDWKPPAPDAHLSSGQLAEAYFVPLAHSDLLADSVLVGTEVLSIERDASPDGQPPAEDEVPGFRLRVRDAAGERVDTADVVIDASGAMSSSFELGPREVDYYVLGTKSADVPGDFLFAEGLAQIRDLFRIIADNSRLDLYATFAAAPPPNC
jgi:threonine dehydrogenase-like Zn-dependent dehydrogenase